MGRALDGHYSCQINLAPPLSRVHGQVVICSLSLMQRLKLAMQFVLNYLQRPQSLAKLVSAATSGEGEE